MRTRKLIGLVLGGACLLLTAGEAHALDILLTNDDGFDAPGIQALAAALRRAGNDVTVFAPSSNRSGSSASLTFAPITVKRTAPEVYAVDASPASTVTLGASESVEGIKRPDLIVSGINAGANIGPSTPTSGTIGATIAAILELRKPIPAIAFSTDLVEPDQTSAANKKNSNDVAAFAARLVGVLNGGNKVLGLRPGLALNVNYPALAPNAVKGVRLAAQGLAVLFPPSFEETKPGTYVSTARPVEPKRDVPLSDTLLFYKGYITIVPIDGDYTTFQALRGDTFKRMSHVRP